MSRTRTSAATALAALALLAPTAGRAARGADFAVDKVHSTVLFRVKHMNTSYSYGRFNDVSGHFALDDKNPSQSAVDVAVKAETVDTGNAARDKHLRGPDFLNAVQFPEMRFKSTAVTASTAGPGTFDVAGDLTLHGVTRPLTVRVIRTGAGKDPRGKVIQGLYADFAVKRSDFGMKGMVGPVGDEILVTVSLEGGQR
jgi:polyisoprenoid-binding protein YceI